MNGLTPRDEPELKRRKLRKGTHSCWECKRRKVKCLFAAPTDLVCITCQRRKTKCVSQDLPEEPTQSQDAAGRIERVEHMLSELVRQNEAVQNAPSLKQADIAATFPSHPTPPADIFLHPDIRPKAWTQSDTCKNQSPATFNHIQPSLPSPLSESPTVQHGPNFCTQAQQAVLKILQSALPGVQDLQLLRDNISGFHLSCYQTITIPRHLMGNTVADPHGRYIDPNMLPNHPVLLAKQMLNLSSAIQATPWDESVIARMSEHPRSVHKRLVEAVAANVTSNDNFLGTLEHLECIILEAFYHKENGNIRRAWVTLRRAMTAAQLMGLHRHEKLSLKQLDPRTKVYPEQMWHTTVFSERLLSLLLALPTSSPRSTRASLSTQDTLDGPDDFQASLSCLMAQIIDRNDLGLVDEACDLTNSIDEQMVALAQRQSPTFWRPLNFTNLQHDSEDVFWESLRAFDHIAYFTCLNQLHLPAMLSPLQCGNNSYSTMACVNASRDVLTRVIAFRSFHPVTAVCRMADLLALVAGMTLIFAHMISHCRKDVQSLLTHQRLGDRAITEQTLDYMTSVSKLNGDVVTSKCVTLLRHLLAIESDAAQGNIYWARKLDGTEEEDLDPWTGLLITVPHIGIIKIARKGSVAGTITPQEVDQSLQDCVTLGGIGSVQVRNPISRAPSPEAGDNLQSSVHPAPHINLTSSHEHIGQANSFESLDSRGGHLPTAPLATGALGDVFTQDQTLFPDPAAGYDDWVFQGFDTAFFDNFIKSVGS